jgi:hypothetical protein
MGSIIVNMVPFKYTRKFVGVLHMGANKHLEMRLDVGI